MLANWVRATSSTTGTGDLTLSAVSGYPQPSDAFAVGQRWAYCLLDDSTGAPVEAGIGYLSAGTTFVREYPTATYVGGTLTTSSVTAATLSGTTRLICAATAEATPVNPPNIDPSAGSRVFSPYLCPVTGGTMAVTTDRCYYVPVMLNTVRELDAIIFRVSSGSGTSTAKVGIYRANGSGRPGDKIEESASLSTGTAYSGVKQTGTLTKRRYTPGLYFVAFACNGAATINAPSGVTTEPLLGGDANSVLKIGAYYEALTSGWTSLPTTASATPTAIAGQSSVFPLLSMRAA